MAGLRLHRTPGGVFYRSPGGVFGPPPSLTIAGPDLYYLAQVSGGNYYIKKVNTGTGALVWEELLPVSPFPKIPQIYIGPGRSAITAASWSSGVATVSIGSHDHVVGSEIRVTNASPSGYNTTSATITAVTSTTVSYGVVSDPGTYVTGGTLWHTNIYVTHYSTLAAPEDSLHLRKYNNAGDLIASILVTPPAGQGWRENGFNTFPSIAVDRDDIIYVNGNSVIVGEGNQPNRMKFDRTLTELLRKENTVPGTLVGTTKRYRTSSVRYDAAFGESIPWFGAAGTRSIGVDPNTCEWDQRPPNNVTRRTYQYNAVIGGQVQAENMAAPVFSSTYDNAIVSIDPTASNSFMWKRWFAGFGNASSSRGFVSTRNFGGCCHIDDYCCSPSSLSGWMHIERMNLSSGTTHYSQHIYNMMPEIAAAGGQWYPEAVLNDGVGNMIVAGTNAAGTDSFIAKFTGVLPVADTTVIVPTSALREWVLWETAAPNPAQTYRQMFLAIGGHGMDDPPSADIKWPDL